MINKTAQNFYQEKTKAHQLKDINLMQKTSDNTATTIGTTYKNGPGGFIGSSNSNIQLLTQSPMKQSFPPSI
eukprot:CAMPEP_0170567580 /NCGR_PEP_ID=MMETSP0211-20121228/80568_1 /TAXON_ID=311385 /ORGANISM="Pseudokeronopsis sp., Strain OXSARD2" /LENGTH=71 /DNA_ID=CAMNT_0010889071 /DNA_START=1584 /DNA_END=1799 /DNA_ORIENTATION=-